MNRSPGQPSSYRSDDELMAVLDGLRGGSANGISGDPLSKLPLPHKLAILATMDEVRRLSVHEQFPITRAAALISPWFLCVRFRSAGCWRTRSSPPCATPGSSARPRCRKWRNTFYAPAVDRTATARKSRFSSSSGLNSLWKNSERQEEKHTEFKLRFIRSFKEFATTNTFVVIFYFHSSRVVSTFLLFSVGNVPKVSFIQHCIRVILNEHKDENWCAQKNVSTHISMQTSCYNHRPHGSRHFLVILV